MPIDILKILVENKNCLPFEHSNLFKTAELNGMKGFMIHSIDGLRMDRVIETHLEL